MTPEPGDFAPQCPLPLSDYPVVLLAHGGGGRLMHELIDRVFAVAFARDPDTSPNRHDAAVVEAESARLALTTDSFVVRPLEFPGGDIGTLAVFGTVNDLAMAGACPRWMSVGFIIEEGLEMDRLWRFARSMRAAADRCGIEIVTGDTKVVDRGRGDGLYLNTTGVGEIDHDLVIAPESVRPGDAILLSGDLGRHGIAVMAEREGLEFECPIQSDCAPLADPVRALLQAGLHPHCLRDLTRGGLSSALNEIAAASSLGIHVREESIPIDEAVQGACEILGLDPFFVANEGRFIAILPRDEAEAALRILQNHEVSAGACLIGEVREDLDGLVVLESRIGASRVLDMLSGEQLPRIC